jgi:S1-C subfamily serine protease
VGIVTGIINPTDQNFFIGIGFAVPITVAASGGGLPPY